MYFSQPPLNFSTLLSLDKRAVSFQNHLKRLTANGCITQGQHGGSGNGEGHVETLGRFLGIFPDVYFL